MLKISTWPCHAKTVRLNILVFTCKLGVTAPLQFFAFLRLHSQLVNRRGQRKRGLYPPGLMSYPFEAGLLSTGAFVRDSSKLGLYHIILRVDDLSSTYAIETYVLFVADIAGIYQYVTGVYCNLGGKNIVGGRLYPLSFLTYILLNTEHCAQRAISCDFVRN